MTVFLTPEELAERWRESKWTVYEKTRLNRVPLRQMPGSRHVLIPLDDLEAFEAGAVELEVIETRNASGCGRIVRPVMEEAERRTTRRRAVSTPARSAGGDAARRRRV